MAQAQAQAPYPDHDAPTPADLVGTGYPNAQMQAVLDTLAQMDPQPIENLTPQEAREQPTPADAVMALLAERGESTDPQPLADVGDYRVLTPVGEIPVRVYTPEGHGPFPVLVYAHGGGWVIADVQTYDASCRALANAVPGIVVSVEYRQAPEHPFPAAVEDVYAVYRWALNSAMEINGDPGRVAIAGESAGGNMAAVVCQMAKQDGVPLPLHQALIYPVTDFAMDTHSYAEHADAVPLNRDMMAWFAGHYLPNAADRSDWRAAPLHGDLHGLPPATIVLAEIDPLRSEGEAYLAALRAAGVEARGTVYHGVTHEFFGMTAVLDAARDAVAEVAGELRLAFATATPEADTLRDAGMAARVGAGMGMGMDADADLGMQPDPDAAVPQSTGTRANLGMDSGMAPDTGMGTPSRAPAGMGAAADTGTDMDRAADARLAAEVDRSINMDVDTPHAAGAVSGTDPATDLAREKMADRDVSTGVNPQRAAVDGKQPDAFTTDAANRATGRDAQDATYPDASQDADPLLLEPAASDAALDPTRADESLPGVEPVNGDAAALVNIGDLVLGSDANPVGRVIDIRPDGFLVERGAQATVLVPLDSISRAEAGQAVLYLPAEDVGLMQWDVTIE